MERGRRPQGLWPAEPIAASRPTHPMYDIGQSCRFRSLDEEVCEFQLTLRGRHFEAGDCAVERSRVRSPPQAVSSAGS